MANHGPNQGRRLRLAISRFAAMLVAEARDLTGLSYPALDEALGLESGTSCRYAIYPPRKKTRAPQAAKIQSLENGVAKLLRRPAHKIVIENTAALQRKSSLAEWIDLFVGYPLAEINLRESEPADLELGYEYDWPTYSRLGKFSRVSPLRLDRVVNLYAWQWGILWDEGVLPPQWSRERLGIPLDTPVEVFLPNMVRNAAIERFVLALSRLLSSFGELDEETTLDIYRALWHMSLRHAGLAKAPDRFLNYAARLPLSLPGDFSEDALLALFQGRVDPTPELARAL